MKKIETNRMRTIWIRQSQWQFLNDHKRDRFEPFSQVLERYLKEAKK